MKTTDDHLPLQGPDTLRDGDEIAGLLDDLAALMTTLDSGPAECADDPATPPPAPPDPIR